jgi:integrase
MIVLDRTRLIDHLIFLTIIICNQYVSFPFLGVSSLVVQTLVQSHLYLRGDTYYFRYVLPAHLQSRCPSLPTEIKRSLRTDSYSAALALVCSKLPLIKLIRDCKHRPSIEKLFHEISNFTQQPIVVNEPDTDFPIEPEPTVAIPALSEAWTAFSQWKTWTDKQGKANHRIFNNLIFFLGDIPVSDVTKAHLRAALSSISRLPQRNKKNYKQMPLEQLVSMSIPQEDIVSGKYVKEHHAICQSLFSRYLKDEVDVLVSSPTEGLKYDYQANRYASMNDDQVRTVLAKSQHKPDWFKWFMMLSVYSGARRSELVGLKKSDFKYCTDSNRHYFHIRHGKTKAAIRAVPLHQQLIDSGMLAWIDSSNSEQIFNVNANRVTDLFNSLPDERVNILGERIVLHSVRHTFITKARAAGISNVLVQQVVGHEKSGAGQTDRYTHTFHLKDVLPVVDSISF